MWLDQLSSVQAIQGATNLPLDPSYNPLDQAQLGLTGRARLSGNLCFLAYTGLYHYRLLPQLLYMTSNINRNPYTHP